MKSLSLILFVLSMIALHNVSHIAASNLKNKLEAVEAQTPNSLAGDSITPFKAENLQEVSNALVKVNFEKKLLLVNDFRALPDNGRTYPITGPIDSNRVGKIPEFDYSLVATLPLARLKIIFILPAAGIESEFSNAAYIFYLFFNDSEVAANTFIITSLKNTFSVQPIVLEATIYNVPAKTHKISLAYKTEVQALILSNVSAKLILEGEALS